MDNIGLFSLGIGITLVTKSLKILIKVQPQFIPTVAGVLLIIWLMGLAFCWLSRWNRKVIFWVMFVAAFFSVGIIL